MNQELLTFLIRISASFLLGAVVGFERQWRERMSGLRVNVLVACGACSYVMISSMVSNDSPTRIASQIVTGIGFLGAGVIMKEGLNIRGINTAATMWCSAAFGCLAGLGFIFQACISAIFVLFANTLLRGVSQKMKISPLTNEALETVYKIIVICDPSIESTIRIKLIDAINEEGLRLISIETKKLQEGHIEISSSVASVSVKANLLEKIISSISITKGVTQLKWAIYLGGAE